MGLLPWKMLCYLASLSIWSPNPGVSTMVSEMRVPSSSSSNSNDLESEMYLSWFCGLSKSAAGTTYQL